MVLKIENESESCCAAALVRIFETSARGGGGRAAGNEKPIFASFPERAGIWKLFLGTDGAVGEQ